MAFIRQVIPCELLGPEAPALDCACGAGRHLRRSQWLWRKNLENLTEAEQARMEQLDQENLGTAKAYQMRLSLPDI